MIRVGIVGTGFGRRIHLPGFRRVPGCEVVGFAGKDADKTHIIATAEGLRAFSHWQELIADPQIDAISITTPPVLHAEIAHASFKAGKPVFCEKPLGMNTAEAKTMLDAATNAGVTAMVDFEFRAVPHLEALQAAIEAKKIGRVQHVEITWLTPWRGRPLAWQNELAAGGGVLFNFASHVCDYIHWLLGPIASVEATLGIRHPLSEGARIGDADDTCDLRLTLKNGVSIKAIISNVEPDGRGHEINIVGEDGALHLVNRNIKDAVYGFELTRVGSRTDDVEILMKSDLSQSDEDGRLAPFTSIAECFIQAIPQRLSPSPSFDDGLRVQRVLDAARESNRLGRRVDIQIA